MNSDLFPQPKKRAPLELQLTAMIDIFSMIVIFLIFGTVFGASDVIIPKGMELPKSVSKEGIESAPRVSIEKNLVKMSLSADPIALSDFRSPERRASLKAKLAPLIKDYQEKRKETSPVLSMLADQDCPYADVYDVLSLFRESGFGAILFIATGGAKSP